MSTQRFRPRADEAAVDHPRLVALVKAARAQPTPTVGVRAEAIHEGWQRRRAALRHGVGLGMAAAAAAVLAVSALSPWLEGPRPEAPVARHEVPVARPDVGVDPQVDPPVPSKERAPAAPTRPEPPTLAAAVVVEALGPSRTEPLVLDPRRVRLSEGQWSIDNGAPEPLIVELPDGPLELRGGSIHVEVAGDVARVEVRRGEVVRLEADGRRRALPITDPAAPEGRPSPSTRPTAADLAREAEQRMAAGDREGAIRSLRRLVTQHGRSAAAQAGLIDLGRLLKAAGREAEARCAYAMFLQRWPAHALAGDVTRAQRALGDGPACDGLRPRR